MANTLTLMPWVKEQFLDSFGKPASGFQLFFYAAGTTTKLASYTDSAGSIASSNPIILDAAGRPPSPIFLQAASYKIVLAPPNDNDPPESPEWTVDAIAPSAPFNVDVDIAGTAGETITAGEVVYLSDGTGGKTAGRWYKADADNNYQSTLPACVGFAVISSTSGNAITVRRMGRMTGLSGLTAGTTYYISATAGALTSTAPSNTRRVGVADSTTTLVVAAEIVEPKKGFIWFDLQSARNMSAANIFQTAANIGGLLASDTSNRIQRVNAATDKAVRIEWAAGITIEIQFPSFPYPPDWDDTQAVEVHMLVAMSATNDSPTMAVAYFEGVGDTNAGSSTSAISGTSVQERFVSIAAADVGAHPNFASISLTPAAHATDIVRLYALWVEYVQKLQAT